MDPTSGKANIYAPSDPPPYSSQHNYPPQSHTYPQAQLPPQPGYPVPPGQFYPQPVQFYPQAGHTVVTTAPVLATGVPVVVNRQMGLQPSSFTCKSCNTPIVTRTERNPTMRTHLFAFLLFLIGCWPCCCLPYCIDSCNNVDHYCPNCNSYVGTHLN